ncbi:MAG: hypothetical protein IPP68_07495 [Elusimicrobia bacterium]|nr:hypothetical protein [Elusimicrobiota bacterium]
MLDEFNRIETQIKDIIIHFIHPSPEMMDFSRVFLMDNSIISFASKVKILLAINAQTNFVRIRPDEFHELLRIRNAFAHNQVLPKFNKSDQLTFLKSEVTKNIPKRKKHRFYYYTLDTIQNNGKIKMLERNSAFLRFSELSETIQKTLKNMSKIILANQSLKPTPPRIGGAA